MWVLVALVSLAVAVLLVMSVPLELRYKASLTGKPRFSLWLSWLHGMVKKDMTAGRASTAARHQNEAEKPLPKRGAGNWRLALKLLGVRGLIKRIKRLIRDVLRHVHHREVQADLTIGLNDPADAGMLFSFLGPATVFTDLYTSFRFTARPVISDEIYVKGNARGKIRLRPIELVLPVFRFLFSRPVFRTLIIFVSHKWKRR